MPAHAKLTRRCERRLLALVENGVTLAEASRAVGVSRQTLYRHARADPFFAVELRAVRAHAGSSPADAAVAAFAEPLDWRAAAAQLEAEYPERWALNEQQ